MNHTDATRNRTGIAHSPKHGREMVEAAEEGTPANEPDAMALAGERRAYAGEADPVGTMPPPATLKGAAKNVVTALKNRRPTVLVDKLGERLAFERTGSRLYEALISKCLEEEPPGGPTPAELQDIRDDELQHFELLREAIEALGADPTVQTPCADLGGVESIGLMQVISDPRTTMLQSLHAVLVAELADGEGWRMLIHVTRAYGQDEMADRFEAAEAREGQHLARVRDWIEAMTMAEAQMVTPMV